MHCIITREKSVRESPLSKRLETSVLTTFNQIRIAVSL